MRFFRLTWLVLSSMVLWTRGEASVIREIPFELRDGFISLLISTPSSPVPLRFLLDSGASSSVVDLAMADRLGLEKGALTSVQSVGRQITGFWPTRLSASAGSLRLPNEYLALSLSDVSGACSQPVDGLLGMDFFRGRIVQIDYAQLKIRLLTKAPRFGNLERLPLELRDYGMVVPVRFNQSVPKWVRLDTGCASEMQWVRGDSSLQAAPSSNSTGAIIALTTASGTPETTTIHLGTRRVGVVKAGLVDAEIFPNEAGLLGNGLLKRFQQVTVDAVGGQMILGEFQNRQ